VDALRRRLPAASPHTTVPHVAFKVDDLDRAIEGRNLIHGPDEPLEGFRVAFVEEGGAPIEFIETDLTEAQVIARRRAIQRLGPAEGY
jgi:hypothetical protein